MTSCQFLSNEKNTSLFTQLLCGARDVFITVASYPFLKDFKVTLWTVVGVTVSSIGACLISLKSILMGFAMKPETKIEGEAEGEKGKKVSTEENV